MLSSDKRQSHTWYTFLLCLVITDSKLTEKDLHLSILLKICTLNLLFSYEKKNKFNTFRWYKHNFSKY